MIYIPRSLHIYIFRHQNMRLLGHGHQHKSKSPTKARIKLELLRVHAVRNTTIAVRRYKRSSSKAENTHPYKTWHWHHHRPSDRRRRPAWRRSGRVHPASSWARPGPNRSAPRPFALSSRWAAPRSTALGLRRVGMRSALTKAPPAWIRTTTGSER